ncbi:twin-arginine translocase subunit TatC [Aneurinibacillus danicus]|jgi:sec-independent protein translocase protein TatC|uniref:Sec-independent protein translocase protein TatC n=1 Tax=Aneurinibacillus danicus TaxID=267746 RepID=A0A511VCU7_9BACL|nr:twin-arginine translocase subunit TatC [Aneurinibacillus danicus]GEN36231.1 Sec-independent protein translocase protein TatCy [Aneurinibacillus danicus]
MSTQDREMRLVEHLGELRRRLIWIAVIFIIAFIVGFSYAQPIVHYFQKDAGIQWHVFGIADGLRVYMQFSFVIALVITLPFILYHLWRFISPGLRPHERRAAGVFIAPAFLLFLAGLAVGYYLVFPMIITFMIKFSGSLGAEETFGLAQYFGFMFNIIIPLALLFELPIIVMFLTRLRILNPMRMQKMRGYSYLALVIVASLISPPDFVSHLSVFLPLVILYEISVLISRVIYRKQLKEDAEWEKEFYGDKKEEDAVLRIERE